MASGRGDGRTHPARTADRGRALVVRAGDLCALPHTGAGPSLRQTRPPRAARWSSKWLNVSGGVDADVTWSNLAGGAHAPGPPVGRGVGAAHRGRGRPGAGAGPGRRGQSSAGASRPSTRFGTASLEHPGDGYSFDIFTQVARALRAGSATGGAPSSTCSPPASRSRPSPSSPTSTACSRSPGRSTASSCTAGPSSPFPSWARVSLPTSPVVSRAVPVLLPHRPRRPRDGPPVRERRGRRPRLRPACANRTATTSGCGRSPAPRTPTPTPSARIAEALDCGVPINDGPLHVVAKAAFRGLDDWVRTGDAPPEAPRLDADRRRRARPGSARRRRDRPGWAPHTPRRRAGRRPLRAAGPGSQPRSASCSAPPCLSRSSVLAALYPTRVDLPRRPTTRPPTPPSPPASPSPRTASALIAYARPARVAG